MKRVNVGILAGLMGLICTGCIATTGSLTESFGTSLELAKVNQTLNPEASANLKAVEGFDGGAANHAIERYGESFKLTPRKLFATSRTDDLSQ